jgi:hypothetical protein
MLVRRHSGTLPEGRADTTVPARRLTEDPTEDPD